MVAVNVTQVTISSNELEDLVRSASCSAAAVRCECGKRAAISTFDPPEASVRRLLGLHTQDLVLASDLAPADPQECGTFQWNLLFAA